MGTFLTSTLNRQRQRQRNPHDTAHLSTRNLFQKRTFKRSPKTLARGLFLSKQQKSIYNHSWRRPHYFRLLVPNRINRRGVDQKKIWNLLLFFAVIKRDGHFIPLSERREYKRKTLIGRGCRKFKKGVVWEGGARSQFNTRQTPDDIKRAPAERG